LVSAKSTTSFPQKKVFASLTAKQRLLFFTPARMRGKERKSSPRQDAYSLNCPGCLLSAAKRFSQPPDYTTWSGWLN
jgi:hypothetical protein